MEISGQEAIEFLYRIIGQLVVEKQMTTESLSSELTFTNQENERLKKEVNDLKKDKKTQKKEI